MTKTFTLNENLEIPLEEFKDFIDISKIIYYSMEVRENRIVVKFYNENKEEIKLK